jgi:hypothetical protein
LPAFPFHDFTSIFVLKQEENFVSSILGIRRPQYETVDGVFYNLITRGYVWNGHWFFGFKCFQEHQAKPLN